MKQKGPKQIGIGEHQDAGEQTTKTGFFSIC